MSKKKTKKDKINPFVEESFRILHNAYISKKLVLFVGAGVDIYSGLPTWAKAIEQFCVSMGISDDANKIDNLRIPQYYYNSRGKKEYNELCREIFCYDRQLAINDVHKKIVDLNVKTIITTNYTDFIQKEMSNRGHMYKTICQDKDLAYVRDEKLIIKMHGDFEHDNFVLKEDDYLRYSSNFRLMETYIKGIIATNIVLFVGYSFNDPDLKQLFSWIKDILGDDFQQAYMLEAYYKYDKNEFEYYKNLGVNVIYLNNKNKDVKSVLLEGLNRVKYGQEKKMSALELANVYFEPYLNTNYILERFLNEGLSLCKLRMECGRLQPLYTYTNEEKKINMVMKYLSDRLKKDVISQDEPYYALLSAIRKSGTVDIELIDWSKKTRNLSIVNVSNDYDMDMLNSIISFDYNALRKNAELDDYYVNGDDIYTYLKQAFSFYILSENNKAYKCLYKVADKAYQNNQDYIYYIIQFNRHRLGEIIKHDYKTPDKVKDKINEDLERINLNSIINNIQETYNNDNRMIKDIGSFQLHFSVFQDAYRFSKKVEKQQETVFSFFSGKPDYHKLRWMIMDYYRFIVCNYLMVDFYQEIKEVFSLYINTIIRSILTPDKEAEPSIPNFGMSGNIHVTELTKFDMFLIIRYMSESEIVDMFEKCGDKYINIEEGYNNYIKKVIENLREKNIPREEEFWHAIALVTHIDIDFMTTELVLDAISYSLDTYIIRTHQKVISKFIHKSFRNRKFKVKQEGEFTLDDYALGRALKKILKVYVAENDIYEEKSCMYLISNLLYYIKKIYGEDYNEDIRQFICEEKCLLIAKMYPYCSSTNKNIIKKFFNSWEGDCEWDSLQIYYEIVRNEIIKPSEKFEKQIYKVLPEVKDQSKNCYPSTYNNMLFVLCNLYLDKKLVCSTELLSEIESSDNMELQFLINMEKFDYTNFRLEWLYGYSEGLMRKIAKNPIARKEIQNLFLDKIEQLEEKLVKLYFKYFGKEIIF